MSRAITISLRWEATGPASDLFPALDADLPLVPEGNDRSRLSLTGSYRPPLGGAGKALDKVIMGRVARVTVRLFLHGVADAVTGRAVADPQAAVDIPSPRGLTLEPGEPRNAG